MREYISIIGAGGLLGRSVTSFARNGDARVSVLTSLRWSDPAAVLERFRRLHVTELATLVDARWIVVWCAGGGRVGASTLQMSVETKLVQGLVDLTCELAGIFSLPTVFVFASSGGAIWSGSPRHVLRESTPPQPSHDYGTAKLEQERYIAESVGSSRHVRARLSRISNLYGPEHSGGPARGLIGHLVRNALTRTPTSIYVPLDTQRDYIYVDHAASLMLRDGRMAFGREPGACTVDLVASGESHTIAGVASALGQVLTRKVPLTVGFSPLAAQQPMTLAFSSSRRDLKSINPIPLVHGLHRMVTVRLANSPT